jgi:hypothetical protein
MQAAGWSGDYEPPLMSDVLDFVAERIYQTANARDAWGGLLHHHCV